MFYNDSDVYGNNYASYELYACTEYKNHLSSRDCTYYDEFFYLSLAASFKTKDMV